MRMRSFSILSTFSTLSQVAFGLSLDTDVVIISNNDLDPSNPSRSGALLLRTPLSCSRAVLTCADLQETLLPFPTSSTGFTSENLTSVLISERHGAALASGSKAWIAGSSGCVAFTLGSSYPFDDTANPLSHFPALCTNSAPLTHSNVTSDTTRQIDVSTPKAGILRGFRDKFTWRFLGIKYAASTAGQGRFRSPTPFNVSSDTLRTASSYGPFCAQPPDVDNGHMLHIEEDCLSLNVYSPVARGKISSGVFPKLPVMFYIHGGGLTTGNSGPFPYNTTTDGYVGNSISNIYDGTNLVSYGGVVLITINYRLTAFGWFNASNAALKDTLLALRWVQDNIESFGGDPAKVLIFGESAGGTMTRYLLGTNQKYTHGLFSGSILIRSVLHAEAHVDAAILVSDFSTANPFYSPELALNTSLTLAKYLGCASDTSVSLSNADVICVQDTPAGNLALAVYELGLSWDIVIDGDYVLNDISSSVRDGVYARVPTLWSTTECDFCYFLPSTLSPTAPPSAYAQTLPRYFSQPQIAKILQSTTLYPYNTAPDEGGMSGAILTLAQLLTDWVVLCPSTYLAALESNTTNPGNAYHAVFATGLGSPLTPNPGMCRGRVCHADELYWVFGTAETDGLYQPLSAQQVEVTREVMKRFTEMAWSGSPNYVGAEVVWEGYGPGENEVVVNVTTSVRPGYRTAQCTFMAEELGFVYGYRR
ncbi:alpha beta-hydrolase [Chiua virens]|nr:alpha beta-hydrolase [Chiua virens]